MGRKIKKINYCLTVYGGISEDLEGITEIVKSFTTDKPVIYGAKAMLITAFSSFLELDEIEFFMKDGGYSFMIFEMDEKTSRGFTIHEDVQKRIFDDFYEKTDFDEYVDYEDVGIGIKENSELYLKDLLVDLDDAINEDKFEDAAKIRDEIKEIDVDFYEKYVKNKDSLE